MLLATLRTTKLLESVSTPCKDNSGRSPSFKFERDWIPNMSSRQFATVIGGLAPMVCVCVCAGAIWCSTPPLGLGFGVRRMFPRSEGLLRMSSCRRCPLCASFPLESPNLRGNTCDIAHVASHPRPRRILGRSPGVGEQWCYPGSRLRITGITQAKPYLLTAEAQTSAVPWRYGANRLRVWQAWACA